MKYEQDRKGLAAYLTSSPELNSVLREAAELGAQAARAVAPVDSGEYRDSIRAEDGGIAPRVGRAGPRQSYHVVADVPYAADVEFRAGSVKPLSGAAVNAIEGA